MPAPRLTVIRPDGKERAGFPLYGDAARFGNERSIYFIKRLPTGEVRAYDRQYGLIGIVDEGPLTIGAVLARYQVDEWRDFNGGSDNLRGHAFWVEDK